MKGVQEVLFSKVPVGVDDQVAGAEVGDAFGGRVDGAPLVRLAGGRGSAGGGEKRDRAAVVVSSEVLQFETELAQV